jgi:hypothetical protein
MLRTTYGLFTVQKQTFCVKIHALQGLARRKNCCAPEIKFVTVYCPPTTAGVRETGAQTTGAKRFVVDCKVNPALLVGHVKIIELGAALPGPAELTVTASTGGVLDTTGVVPDTSVGENAGVLSPAASSLKSIPPT